MSIRSTVVDRSRDGIGRLVHAYSPRTWKEKGLLWTAGLALVTYLVVVVILGILWSGEPGHFDVPDTALEMANGDQAKLVPGYTTTAATIRIAETLLDKPGGFLSNDVSLPSLYLDNIPNWESGALFMLRDMVRAMRNDFSRSQTQSVEDKDLVDAQILFNNDSERWIWPAAEGKYEEGIAALQRYLERLADDRALDGQFFTRADNLHDFLAEVEKRLGNYAQQLAASVGEERFNIDLAGDPQAQQSTPTSGQTRVQTPWLQIDDVFYEARGYTWALLHVLMALEIDFAPVLKDKNAQVSMHQIIRELEGSQETLWSPMVLNGTGFGPLANHSLVMASYVSRANAAIIDLRQLLRTG